MAFALALVELLLPSFAAFMNAALRFEYWRDPELVAGIALLVAIVGAAAGLYPAFVLSAFRPAMALKGSPTGAHPDVVRFSLVVLQFSILIVALVTTGTIFRQMQFALSEALRVNQDQVLLINGGCTEAFKEAVASLPGVRAAACAGGTALSMGFEDAGVQLADGTSVQTRHSQIDFGFFELYGLKPLAGRFFARNHADDAVVNGATANPSIVLNQSAAKKLGFASPAAAVGQIILWTPVGESDQAAPRRSTIIGVVQDFSMNSVRERIEPQIYYIDPKLFNLTNVKLDGARIPETLASIDRLWRTLNGDAPVNRVFLDEMMRRKYLDIIRQGDAFTLFTAIALLIACVGLFGLAVSTAERRTKEIGIRKSMGAGTGDILRLLTWEFAKPVIWANLLAWPAAYFAMSHWLSGFAYHIDLDVWMFLAAGAVALVIALTTVSVQSLITARAKPVTALRYE
jgi:putative ABC transport system permease protein